MTQFDSLMEHHTRDRARRSLHRPDAVEGPYNSIPEGGNLVEFTLIVVAVSVLIGFLLGVWTS